MSKTLIVAATFEELAGAFEYFKWPKKHFVQTSGYDVLITGVGITATAFALGKRLTAKYHLVINVGIAGSFDKNIPLGSLVNITRDTFSELGAEDGNNFITVDELGFGQSTFAPGLTTFTHEINYLPSVKGITVNTVHGNASSIGKLLDRLPVQTESMEGAAVFYACEQMNISALQVRGISNYVEQRNKENWQIGLAIKNLNEWLIELMS